MNFLIHIAVPINYTSFIPHHFCKGSSGGVVVKLLACGARGPEFDPQSRRFDFDSEIGYLLLPSRDMAERLLNRR